MVNENLRVDLGFFWFNKLFGTMQSCDQMKLVGKVVLLDGCIGFATSLLTAPGLGFKTRE
ncbi:hypothetical protein EFO70_06320 [Lacticaseibacillus rhamnosus]|nr:hypothetical protein [Lacticaseibacillus rhamnosus]MCT3181142.1 hypothetical protein [Lacticaseibacillus rhamnosus]